MTDNHRPVTVIWRFTDGKVGHENQSQGLVDALQARLRVDVHSLQAGSGLSAIRDFLLGRFPAGKYLPDPDLLIGAGHTTHLPMLAARRARGGRIVVLMKASLPVSWFDLCLIPEHDLPARTTSILVTHGVLNRIRYSEIHDDKVGLFLIGGPSPHANWSNRAIIEQIRVVLERTPELHWWLTTSRRTPDNFLHLLDELPDELGERLSVEPFEDAGDGWLPEKLGQASRVWVTEESVSMVYEALTSGAAVGLLAVPTTHQQGRVARGVEGLVREGLVVCFAQWEQGREMRISARRFDEAVRCADWIIEQWPSEN